MDPNGPKAPQSDATLQCVRRWRLGRAVTGCVTRVKHASDKLVREGAPVEEGQVPQAPCRRTAMMPASTPATSTLPPSAI
eukprot:719068-Prorocentrum_minimum.AAC.1